jgi:porphyrinogen peroxidase
LKPEVRKQHVLNENGSSFMLAQKWVHDLKKWNKFTVKMQEQMIGRTKKDSVELDPLPPTSHVGKTDSRMKMFRQSMSFGDSNENGLLFIAYANQMRAFHHALNFMSGSHNPGVDMIIGNLSNAVSGSYW